MKTLLRLVVLNFCVVLLGCGSAGGIDTGTGGSAGGGTPSGTGGSTGSGGGVSTGSGGSSGGTGGGGGGDAGIVILTGTPIVATAALGTGEPLLGTPVDAQFNQVNGNALFRPRSVGGVNVKTPVNQITTGWVQAQSSQDLAANLKGWGLGSAELSATNTTRYISMRAYQMDHYQDVDLTMPVGTAPPSAVYFVSKIYFGHSYEALFSGQDTVLTAGVAATLRAASGSISAKAAQNNLTQTNVGRGLVPNNGMAIFATSNADVMSSYSADGPAVPIYIEYRLIPGVVEPTQTQIPWASQIHATIRIDEINVFHNGSYLDASDTSWVIRAQCRVGNVVQESSVRVWSHNAVSAGGTRVDPNPSIPPQDPNRSDPTSTYGRYAGLAWQRTYAVAAGNTLECVLTGERNDTNPPEPLPPVSILVPSIDSARPVSGYVGNYDTGTDLDYLVHYSVTF